MFQKYFPQRRTLFYGAAGVPNSEIEQLIVFAKFELVERSIVSHVPVSDSAVMRPNASKLILQRHVDPSKNAKDGLEA